MRITSWHYCLAVSLAIYGSFAVGVTSNKASPASTAINSAAPYGASTDTVSATEQLRQFVRNSKTAEGDFVQQQLRALKPNESQDKGLKVIRQTQGHFYFQRPGRFAWETNKPYEQKLISDGKQLITWDKDLKQATYRPAGDALAATPAAILFGEAALDEHFDLVEDIEHNGLRWVDLKPKAKKGGAPGNTDLAYTKISVGMKGGLPSALELLDGLGNVVLVSFSQYQLNVNFAPSRFSFNPPPGTEIVKLK